MTTFLPSLKNPFSRLIRASTLLTIICRYKLYEDATAAALIDRYGNGSSSTCAQPQEMPVVMVVGAGRGPIVRAALQVMYSIINSFQKTKLFWFLFCMNLAHFLEQDIILRSA